MKVELELDREKVPLMKALHELGLAHGVYMVVVAIPMVDPGGSPTLFCIDHEEQTQPRDVADMFEQAARLLVGGAVAIYRDGAGK